MKPRAGKLPALRGRDSAGFALLITITLLAFLVLLLVSLSALTRVETQVAGNNQVFMQARENALLALNVALGQLQQYAGPDQRVTATSGLASASPKNPHLTGVWDATAASLSPASPKTWLTSGNEGTTPLAVGPDTLDPTTAAAADEVFLVGNQTVSASADRIKARLQPITAATPGVTGNQTVGHFAWWVGDENTKADVSLVDSHASAVAAERIDSFATAQRTGIERVADATGTALGDANNYPANSASLARVMKVGQLPWAGATATAQTALSTVVHDRFHDLTAGSFSVLADVADGGLKKDLTAWLSAQGTLPTDAPADTDPIIPAGQGGTGFLMPQWGLIRSYNAIRSQPGVAVAPQLPTQSQQGVNPVITYVNLGLAVSQGLPADALRPLEVHLYPTLVLWNPLNVPIAAADYELCFSPRFSGNWLVFTFSDAGEQLGYNMNEVRIASSPFSAATATSAWYRFNVSVTQAIQPGQSLVFTLADTEDGKSYAAGGNTLVNAFSPGNSVIVSGATALTVAQRAATIAWSSATTGGSLVAVLRAPGQTPPTTEAYQLLPGSYDSVQLLGYGAATGSLPPTKNNPEAIGAQVAWYAEARRSGNNQTSRWITSLNPRAILRTRLGMENGYDAFFFSGFTSSPLTFESFPSAPLAATQSAVTGVQADSLVLAEFLPIGLPLMSLAQLQQVNFSLIGNEPAYAVGNSAASYYVPLTATSLTDTTAPIATQAVTVTQDLSYLLNQALYDRYFFSTVPDAPSDTQLAADIADPSYYLPDGRYGFQRTQGAIPVDEVRGRGAFDSAAGHLMVAGGFNVNSTSEQAWRAELASLNGINFDPQNETTSTTALAYPFSRFIRPAGTSNQVWSGLRELTADQIDRLAFAIVREVKARGPFRSMADFVNRRLQATDATAGLDGGAGFKGAIQAAIDRMDYETTTDGGPPLAPLNTAFAGSSSTTLVDVTHVRPASITGIPAADFGPLVQGGTGVGRTYASRAAGAPGYLTQADVLSALGAVLTVRSDTFLVRTYGDVLNPVTGATMGRAWCEAVVQRLPQFVDSTANTAWSTPTSGGTNAQFGRRFRIVSFRWLGAGDI